MKNIITMPIMGEAEFSRSGFGSENTNGERETIDETQYFGLFEYSGRVYAEPIVDTSKASVLEDMMLGMIGVEEVLVNISGLRGYDAVVAKDCARPFYLRSLNKDIHNFWEYAKHRLRMFNGISGELFELYLKETEFRFNHRDQNLYLVLLRLFRNNPLFQPGPKRVTLSRV
jgi:hypothetical protein